MAQITLGGNPINTIGNLPAVGTKAADFNLVKEDFTTASLNDFKGQKVILNIFPSVATGVCSASVRRFNDEASKLENTKVLCISRDLPFAQQGFCASEGLKDVINLSDFVDASFGKDYGLLINDGKWNGLLSRCVVILDEEGTVVYTEQVPEIAQEPDYESAIAAL